MRLTNRIHDGIKIAFAMTRIEIPLPCRTLYSRRDQEGCHKASSIYRDLAFRVFDRNSGKEMVWHSVLGFAGGVATRASNPGKPEDDPRDGKIDYTCGENDIVFFEYFVKSLISGIKRIVLIV